MGLSTLLGTESNSSQALRISLDGTYMLFAANQWNVGNPFPLKSSLSLFEIMM